MTPRTIVPLEELERLRARAAGKRERELVDARARALLERAGWEASEEQLESAIRRDYTPEKRAHGDQKRHLRKIRNETVRRALEIQRTEESGVRRIDPKTYQPQEGAVMRKPPPPTYSEFAREVDERRKLLGLSQVELGRAIGRSDATIVGLIKHHRASKETRKLLRKWLEKTANGTAPVVSSETQSVLAEAAVPAPESETAEDPPRPPEPEKADPIPTPEQTVEPCPACDCPRGASSVCGHCGDGGTVPQVTEFEIVEPEPGTVPPEEWEGPREEPPGEAISYKGAHGHFIAESDRRGRWQIGFTLETDDVSQVAELARIAARSVFQDGSPAR